MERLQRDGYRENGGLAALTEGWVVGAQAAVRLHVPPGLPHHPDGHSLDGLATIMEETRLRLSDNDDGLQILFEFADMFGALPAGLLWELNSCGGRLPQCDADPSQRSSVVVMQGGKSAGLADRGYLLNAGGWLADSLCARLEVEEP